MKKDIHPENYRLVVFKDMSCDYTFITRSTVPSKETIKWEDGKEYPLFKVEISHRSHPFFTGKMQFIDTAGRIEKFKRRYEKASRPAQPAPPEPVAQAAPAATEAPVPAETPKITKKAPLKTSVAPKPRTKKEAAAPESTAPPATKKKAPVKAAKSPAKKAAKKSK